MSAANDAFATTGRTEFSFDSADGKSQVRAVLWVPLAMERADAAAIPIVAMTANAFSSDVQACLNAGMDAHVSKPLDISVLERTLKIVAAAKFSGGGKRR